MNTQHAIYIPEHTPALSYAALEFVRSKVELVPSATDADSVLLPVPTPTDFDLRLYQKCRIFGGNLAKPPEDSVDLLKNDQYLAENAAITAEGAVGMILPNLPDRWSASPVLVLGWGRIGKALSKQLQHLNIPVHVYARKSMDKAMLAALGYSPFESRNLSTYRCIVNTVPAEVLSADNWKKVRPDCYLLELASQKFIPHERVVHGRGLPGKCKPEASGKLIAKTVCKYLQGGR